MAGTEEKIDGFIASNQERTAWLQQYLEECKKRLAATCPEPTFVPKTPAKTRGRRGRKSRAVIEEVEEVQEPLGRSRRGGRQSKIAKGEESYFDLFSS